MGQYAGRRAENAEKRRAEAEVRNELRSKRSPEEQLQRLDLHLGKGIGAKKERARLQRLVENREVKR